MKTLLVGVNSKYIHTALGVRYVAEFTRQQGWQVDLLEETVNTPLLAVLDKLVSAEADVYGFDVHIWSKLFVQRLISLLRRVRPGCRIVLGGPEVWFQSSASLREWNVADYIIQGDGELAFSQLLSRLSEAAADKGQGDFKPEAGPDGRKPEVIAGTPLDLSELPFPYPDLAQVVAEHKIVYYEASRGCPFRCSYCLSSVSGKVRQRPLPLVLQDLQRLIDADVPLVKFVDRTYNLDEGYYLPMLQFLAGADCRTTFHFEVKADLLSEDTLAFLSRVKQGRFQFEVGVQSTHGPTLRAINRTNDWEKLKINCCRILQAGNIHLHTDLIAGLPFEGLAEWSRSFDEVFGLGAPMLQLGFLKVLPGTQMAERQEEYGLVYMGEPPYEILQTKWLSYGDLAFLRRFDKIFDVVHNGGFFPRFLQALLQDFDRPYSCFKYLVERWPKDALGTYNARSVAMALHSIFGSKYERELQEDIFQNIHNWKPEWLDWSAYSRRQLQKKSSV